MASNLLLNREASKGFIGYFAKGGSVFMNFQTTSIVM